MPRSIVPVKIAFVCISLFALTGSCKKNDSPSSVVPKGSRNLGLHVTQAAGQDYPQAFASAKAAGMDCIPVVFQWTALEVSGRYDPQQILEAVDQFFPSVKMPVSLCISPFAAAERDLPPDLMNKSFNDPAMIARFNKLLDTVYYKTKAADIRYFLIGNEADLYLSQHISEWSGYSQFCSAVRKHAKVLWGNALMVGAETTLGAALISDRQSIQQLNRDMDMVCFTYYPIANDFTMLPVSQVSKDIEPLFDLYPDRKLFLEECGCATSSVCKGSDQLQQEFVHEMFRLWDKYADRFVYLGFLWLHDLSLAEAKQVTVDYGLSGSPASDAFTEYIRTLGLRTNSGEPKQAYYALQQEALLRGWLP